MKNYYDILGIAKDANEQDIKAAYKKLALKFHPDRNENDDVAVTKMQEINEAYQTLGDAEKRQMYDMGKSGFTDPTGGFGGNEQINEILRNMGFNINIDFGSASWGGQNNGSQRFQVKQQVNITLHDAIFGCDVELNIPSYINCKDCDGVGGTKAKCHKCNGVGQTVTFLGTMKYPATCVTCNGKGYVLTSTCASCNQDGYKRKTKHLKLKIPAGIQNGTTLHINPEPNNRCDAFVIVGIIPHPRINRNGATLFSTETISCLDAMVGGKKMVETIDGEVELIIPHGTQHGQHLIIEGHGGILTTGRANHIVNVHIEIPKNLSPEQIKKIKDVRNKLVKN